MKREDGWMDLKDINAEMPEGFGVKIDRSQGKANNCLLPCQ